MTEYYFRFVDKLYSSGIDCDGDPIGPSIVRVICESYKVLKHTPKGVRVYGGRYSKDTARFVNNSSRKKFACATKEEALESFLARKERQHSIYCSRVNHAQTAINIGESMLKRGADHEKHFLW